MQRACFPVHPLQLSLSKQHDHVPLIFPQSCKVVYSLLELAAEGPTIILCYFPERQNELRRLLLDPCKSLMSNNESPCSIVLLSSVGQPFAERLQQVRSITFIPSLICNCFRPWASKETLNFHNKFSFFYS